MINSPAGKSVYKTNKGALILVLLILAFVSIGCAGKFNNLFGSTDVEADENTEIVETKEEEPEKEKPKVNALTKASDSEELMKAMKNYSTIGDFEQTKLEVQNFDKGNKEMLEEIKDFKPTAAIKSAYQTDAGEIEFLVSKFSSENDAVEYLTYTNSKMQKVFDDLLERFEKVPEAQRKKGASFTKKENNGSVTYIIKEQEKTKEIEVTRKEENGIASLVIKSDVGGTAIIKCKRNFCFMAGNSGVKEKDAEKSFANQTEIISAFLEEI